MPSAKKITKKSNKNNKKPKKHASPSRLSSFSMQKKATILAILAFGLFGVWTILRSYAATDTGFKHPGVLVSKEQTSFVKSKVDSSQQPWKAAFDQMKSDSKASLSYSPKPVPRLQCTTSGLLNVYQQLGCTELNNDSAAVYTQALMWQMTGNKAYADNAIKIMNAWSSTLREVPFDDPNGTDPKNDAEFFQNRLILGWSAESMVRGAEIIRHSNAGWSQTDITRFENMLKTHYVPQLTIGWTGSNNGAATWADGLMNIGIFTNDKEVFNRGVEHWKYTARHMIYLKATDGDKPQKYFTPRYNKYLDWPQLYNGATGYIDGLAGESCRDLGHTFMGLGALANGAETALLQGVDLYSDPEFKQKLIAGFELNSDYVNQMLDRMAATGQTAAQVTSSTWKPNNFPCPDFKDGGGSAFLGSEIALNHYQDRLGIAMPNTKKLAERVRPQKGGNHLFFETLTHAKTGKVGLAQNPVPTPVTDTKVPDISITSPVDASSASGLIKLVVDARDEGGISKVEVKVGNSLVATKTSAPYSHDFDTKSLPNGVHSITAIAYDKSNNMASSSITITIRNISEPAPNPNPVPVVDTQAPTAPSSLTKSLVTSWSNFRYNLRLNWKASTDNVAVSEYVVTRNGTQLGVSSQNSFEDNTLNAGTNYTYTVVAKDKAGNTSPQATATARAECFLLWCSVK